MNVADEPRTAFVMGLTMQVDYGRGLHVWSATLRHPSLGSYTCQGLSPRMALEAARREVSERWDSLMAGHAQNHAPEVG